MGLKYSYALPMIFVSKTDDSGGRLVTHLQYTLKFVGWLYASRSILCHPVTLVKTCTRSPPFVRILLLVYF